MQYHAPTQQFTVSKQDLDNFAMSLRYAILKLREATGFPATPHPRDVQMSAACHAEHALLSAARHLGVDMGTCRVGALDVSGAA